MARYEVDIFPGEIPVARDADALLRAASLLAVKNTAVILPETIDTDLGIIDTTARKLTALVWALNQQKSSRRWAALQSTSWQVDATSDLGMHGNPFNSSWQRSIDYLHYHRTPKGATLITTAEAGLEYRTAQPDYVHERLNDLLKQGKTDPRFANPDSFQQAVIGTPDKALVFRLNDRTDVPLLHDFRTLFNIPRIAEITPIIDL